jgi:hypothetical protein
MPEHGCTWVKRRRLETQSERRKRENIAACIEAARKKGRRLEAEKLKADENFESTRATSELAKEGKTEMDKRGSRMQLLLQRSLGKVEVVARVQEKNINRQTGTAIKGLISAGFSAAALAKINIIRRASQGATAVRKAMRAAQIKVIKRVSNLWEERSVHLLGTRASAAKTNVMRKVLTMESTMEKEERIAKGTARRIQPLAAEFTKLCTSKMLLQRVAEAGGAGNLTKKK